MDFWAPILEAKTVGKCVRAGEVVLGKAFDGAKKSLSPRQSSVRGDTEGLPKLFGCRESEKGFFGDQSM